MEKVKRKNVQKTAVASCPKCLTFETLWFNGVHLQDTSRFKQDSSGRIFHNCGSSKPCKILFYY